MLQCKQANNSSLTNLMQVYYSHIRLKLKLNTAVYVTQICPSSIMSGAHQFILRLLGMRLLAQLSHSAQKPKDLNWVNVLGLVGLPRPAKPVIRALVVIKCYVRVAVLRPLWGMRVVSQKKFVQVGNG